MRRTSCLFLPLLVLAWGCGGSGSNSANGSPGLPKVTEFKVLESPSNATRVNDVSSDGRIIAGQTTNPQAAIYWIDDEPQALLPSDDAFLFLGGSLSPDGKKVASSTGGRPIVHTIGGSTTVYPIPAGFERGIARDLSDSILLAEAFTSPGGQQSYLVQNDTIRLLPGLSSNDITQAGRIADSGAAAVGISDGKPVRWTNLSNPTVEAIVDDSGVARDLSADGQVVVGDFWNGSRVVAFRWTPTGGAVDLGQLPGMVSMSATAVSADGSVVVGNAYDGNSLRTAQPFIWTQKDGLRAIASLPGFSTPPLEGLEELDVSDISANGRVIVGHASASGGVSKQVGWVIRLASL
jgi:probable HAF family extracellular repeat protein